MQLDKDAFSSGQIGSKIWLVESLENVISNLNLQGLFNQPLKIVLIGGWYGITNFILQNRNQIKIDFVRSVDIDQKACENADLINENWVWQNWKFKALCQDANDTEFFDYDIIINSSVEHIPTLQWWDNIPENKLVVLQSNNMIHDDHVYNHSTIEQFSKDFNLDQTFLLESKTFDYKDWCFTRFMKIGIK
jgi:hypothetical protein